MPTSKHQSHWPRTVASSPASLARENADVDAIIDAAAREETAIAEDTSLSVMNIVLMGVIAAFVALNSSLLSIVPRMFMTLVHELGHTVAGWLFGYPTVPALDFMYGGGVAIHGSRNAAVVGLLGAGAGVGLYVLRQHTRVLIAASSSCLLLLLVGMTPAHQFIIVGAGHWAELVFGAIFLYRALSGAAVVHQIERPLYAFLGTFFILHNVRFSFRLMTSAYYRQLYDEGKATVHRMDFSRMAEEFLHTDITTVATLHMWICLIPITCAVAAYASRDWWRPKLADFTSVL